MDDEYVVEEFSEDDYDTSSSEDEIQTFLKKECGLQEVEDDFETEVDKVMAAHLQKLKSSKEPSGATSSSKAGTSQSISDKQKQINDELFYDPDMDDDDEKWVNAKRRSYIFPADEGKKKNPNVKLKPLPNSDAVLNCPACLSLLCLDCQRHDIYKSQYRAMFVSNCNIISGETLKYPQKKKPLKKHENNASAERDIYNPVRCSVCNTEVGVYDTDEIYHFFNVLASY